MLFVSSFCNLFSKPVDICHSSSSSSSDNNTQLSSLSSNLVLNIGDSLYSIFVNFLILFLEKLIIISPLFVFNLFCHHSIYTAAIFLLVSISVHIFESSLFISTFIDSDIEFPFSQQDINKNADNNINVIFFICVYFNKYIIFLLL
jgi:hypothetical protein